MLVLLRYQLTSEFLGARRTNKGIRVFDEAPCGRLSTALATWDWALKTAAKNFTFGKELDITSVRPEPTWQAPVMQLFSRVYMHNERPRPGMEQNRSKRENFQCVPENTILEHRLLISQGPDTHAARHRQPLREPTLQELHILFEHIGYYMGLSPWGNRLGHGRFKVVTLEEIIDAPTPYPSDAATVSGSPVPGQQCADHLTNPAGDPAAPNVPGEDNDDAGLETGEDGSIYQASRRGPGADGDDLPRTLEEGQGAR